MLDIFRAINHCHQLNIAHRDIKPENLMFGEDGRIKLIDFGLAKQTITKYQRMHTLAGTPYFISPDVLVGRYGKECDMWSLGVLLYLILSGSFPFDGPNRAEVFDKIRKG
jgi:calcium-dependent protein kinase